VAEGVVNKADDDEPAPPLQPRVLSVLRKVWLNGLAVTSVFFVTLSLFPSVVLSVKAADPSFQAWFSIILVVRGLAVCPQPRGSVLTGGRADAVPGV
jgi:hypothetical protein